VKEKVEKNCMWWERWASEDIKKETFLGPEHGKYQKQAFG